MAEAARGDRAAEFLEWFNEFEGSLRESACNKMSKNLTSSELFSLNSILVTCALFRDYMNKVVNNGKIADMEVRTNGTGSTD